MPYNLVAIMHRAHEAASAGMVAYGQWRAGLTDDEREALIADGTDDEIMARIAA